jgi:hypothetical protein
MFFLRQASEHFLQQNVGNFLDFVLSELPEDNDFIQTVEELRTEVLLQFFVHQGTDAVVLRFGLVASKFEAETTATFLNHLRTDVRGHNQQGVLEVHRAALGIGQATIFKNLQQHVEDIGVGFLDLIE